ncbi:hypothetical protein D9619_000618 [Psilocybe cf. subviscida]|uniref:Uncharacterized protein n=1 Tax=Psilocybe cf. subviscida TaxID=2480587 RepID=A0A8H5F2S2_9AGAR|nr:hypothetical protein D9619_000618 [Psilocybe cf. subviscida]
MSFKPTSIAQDAVASTSESDSAPESSNHPKPKRPRFQKPKPEYLESLGIKIKDFAYEKTNLPPIKIVFRHPLQIQPAVPRTIQRSSTEPDAGNASQDSQGMRQPTEPVIMPAATEQIADDDPSSQESTTSPIPEEILFSQASGAVIDTPPVTPNGSLQWGTRFANYAPSTLSQVAGPSRVSNTTVVAGSSMQIPTPTSPLTPLPSFYNSSQNVLDTPTPVFSRIQPARIEVRRSSSIQQLIAQSSGLLVAGRYNLRKRPSPVPLAHKAKSAKRAKLTEAAEPRAAPFKSPTNLRKKATGNAHLRRNGEGSRRSNSKGKGKAAP